MSCEQIDGVARYHVVPIWRLLTLSLLSFNMYVLYWMYQNWKRIRVADDSAIWPFWRSVFGGFTYFSLVSDVNLYGIARSYEGPRLSTSWLGIGFLLASSSGRLPDPYWLISLTNVLFIVPTARRIWALSSEHARNRGARWSLRHTVVSVVFGLFWLLVAYGLTLEE